MAPDEGAHDGAEDGYPHGLQLAAIVAGLAASVFLCALDETIITTAVPAITDEFHSIGDIGWYGSAYFMTFAAFQLIYGKLYTFYSEKLVFLASVAIFESGSLLCAAAPNSIAFIAGRAWAGLGSAGINAGFIIILASALPLHRRPIFVSSYMAMYGLAAVIAPIMGGAFATKSTWRWCFYINLPIGFLAAIAMWFFFHPHKHSSSAATQPLTWREKLAEMDLLGTAFLMPGVILLLLALDWGGAGYAWSSGHVIGVLAAALASLIAFVAIQIWRGDRATVPPRIISQRTVACSAAFVFVAGPAQHILEYYLPIWFQAIQNLTPLDSGTRILPLTLSRVLFSFLAGFGVARLGYYTPFLILGATLLLIGSALTTTLTRDGPTAAWVGFQIVAAAGSGLGTQQAHTGPQRVLSARDVPTGAVVLIFAQIMGSAVWLAVAQNVFAGTLLGGLAQADVAGLEPKDVLDKGATGFRGLVSGEDLERVLDVYNGAVTRVFYVCVGLAAVAVVVSGGVEWKSVRRKDMEAEVEVKGAGVGVEKGSGVQRGLSI